jgi:aminoglycoside 3-N-acetyltransferase
MGRCGQQRAPGLVTRERIAADLKELGVAVGDTLMLHASVGAIGWIVGGPDQVLHGVFDALGQRGTLMMYVGWDGSPYDVTIGLAELPPRLAAAWPPYDPATAHAVRSWGVLAEYLRTWPAAKRSGHPDSSFVASGPLAEGLVGEHPLQYGMGEGSPLARLCEANGKVALLGSPLSNVTLLHHAEHVADVPDKEVVRYWSPILMNGAKEWMQIEEFSTEECLPWFGPGDMFEAILRDYLQGGRGAVGPVGAARSFLFDAADLSQFAVDWIEERYAEPVDRQVDVEVEIAGPADHREVLALFGLLDQEMPGSATPQGRLSTRVDEFLEDPERRVFIARVAGRAAGVLAALRLSPERGALEQAYVDPDHRRRGILRELEIDAAGYLREIGCHSVQLHVAATNEAARAAWQALGYTPTVEFLERPL